jgi:hypothetical protein
MVRRQCAVVAVFARHLEEQSMSQLCRIPRIAIWSSHSHSNYSCRI